MKTWTLFKTVTISGNGGFLFDFPKRNEVRAVVINSQVIRRASSEFLSFKHNPEKGFWANCVLHTSFPYAEYAINFDGQDYGIITDISGQNTLALRCLYRDLITLGERLEIALPGFINPFASFLLTMNPLVALPNFLSVSCYADCAIRFRVYYLEYDGCGEDRDTPDDPDIPRENPDINRPGEPLPIEDGITPREQGFPQDFYKPNPLDEESEDPNAIPPGALYNIIGTKYRSVRNCQPELIETGTLPQPITQTLGWDTNIPIPGQGITAGCPATYSSIDPSTADNAWVPNTARYIIYNPDGTVFRELGIEQALNFS